MLTPAQIAALRDAAGRLADPINDFLLDDIARRIAGAGQLTSTAAYQIYRAQQLGLSRRAIEARLRALLGVNRRTLKVLLTQAAEVGYNFDIKHLPRRAVPFRKNTGVQQMVAAAVRLAQDDFTNLTQTLGMVDPFGRALPLRDAYRSTMDFAFAQVFTGATDYNTAIRRATKNLADLGVRVIDYESGVHTGLEAAVRRNVMGGLGLMVEQIAQKNHDDLGCDGWEISAHAASAPDHEPIQGRQYADRQYERLNGSLKRRIGTLNCGHAAFPIILGVNAPQYTPQALEKLRADNEKGVTYQGRHYTTYEATQQQRRLERAIRRQKGRILVDEAAGDTEKLMPDRIRLQALNQEYARFSRATGLPTQRERATVAGFGRGQAARATAAYQRQQALVSSFADAMREAGISVQGFESYVGDARTLEEMRTAFSRLAEQFPDTAKGLTVAYSHSRNADDLGWFDNKTRTIHYNRAMFKDWATLQKEYAEMVKAGHFPAGTDARGCFYHEFGHAVGDSLELNHKKLTLETLVSLGYGYGNPPHISAKGADRVLPKLLSMYSVSPSGKAFGEVIAECFSEWYTSSTPRAFCEAFLRKAGVI